jgi:ubiquinol-cytochrome c reductase cytochrome b subunit
MFGALVIITVLPKTDLGYTKGLQFRLITKFVFFLFVTDFLVLMVLGAKHVETPYIEIGQIATVLYFSTFLVFIPLASILENTLIDLALNNNLTIAKKS